MRKLLYYKNFRVGVFFLKKVSSREDCAEGCAEDYWYALAELHTALAFYTIAYGDDYI